MGIWGLWESTDPQTNTPGVQTESRGMPSDRSHRYERHRRVGGAAGYWRVDGFQVARSPYQGQFSITLSRSRVTADFRVSRACVQSCRGTSLSEVRYTPEGFEVRVPIAVHRVFTLECHCRMIGNGALSLQIPIQSSPHARLPQYVPVFLEPSTILRSLAKMVLISPRIEHDERSPHGGKLIVSFPPESECQTFEVPLSPTTDLVSQWEL